jgi:branched-chain amino acid transport system substrate-binding protein
VAQYRTIRRRAVLKGLAATAAAATITHPAIAVPATVKIGLVGPKTGPLALFYEEMSWAIGAVQKFTGNAITINGTKHPLEIVVKDSQSSPNRASEVTQELILSDKVNIVTAFAAPETVNPVSDQCEINGMPCVTNNCPLESYFFGRKGNPKRPFEWTYNFFFLGAEAVGSVMAAWARVPTNRNLGALWASDDDGRTFAQILPPVIKNAGFSLIDPGRFDLPAGDFTPEISKFKAAGAELVFTIVPGPDFTIFWNQCAQQGFTPKVVTAGKVGEFPQGVYPYGERAINIVTEVWWSKFFPYSSSLTGQSSQELGDLYEKEVNRQASMGLGFRHSLFEVAIETLKRTQNLDNPASIRDAARDNTFATIVGSVDFKKGPLPNTSKTPLVAGQWRNGHKWPLELLIVDNKLAPGIPVNSEPEVIHYG